MAVYEFFVSDLLVMQEFVTATFQDGRNLEIVESVLSLQQSVSVTSYNPRIVGNFTIAQSAEVNKVIQLSATNFLSLQAQGARTRFISVSNLLQLTQEAYKVLPVEVSDVLVLSQDVSENRGSYNDLSFTQSAICNVIRNLSAGNTLACRSGTADLIDTDWRFVGLAQPETISAYDPSELSIPPITNVPVSFTVGANTLEFPNVLYGDSDRVEHTRISRRTRGEELIVYKKSHWPRTETLKFTLTDLSDAQSQSLLGFIDENLAKVITFKDWLGVKWSGIITNPETQRRQTSRSQRFELEVEFQGEQVTHISRLSLANLISFMQELVLVPSDATDRDVYHSLTFSGSAETFRIRSRESSSTFTITGTATTYSIKTRSLSATLTLTSEASWNQLYNRAIISTITLSSASTLNVNYVRSLTGTLVFVGSATEVQVFNREGDSTFTIIGSASANQVFNRGVNATFSISQLTEAQKISTSPASSTILFVGAASSNSVFNRSNDSTFTITGSASANQVFNRNNDSTFTITGSASANQVFNRSGSSTITIMGTATTTNYGLPVLSTPSGTINSSNVNFTINATTPTLLFLNGILQKLTDDFTVSGTTATFVNAPPTDSVLKQLVVDSAISREIPSGTVNSSNTSFTVASTPSILMLFMNGQLLKDGGADYSLSGTTVTFTTAPVTNSTLQALNFSSARPCTIETPSGTINGSNAAFTLSKTPLFLALFRNGQMLTITEQYTVSTNTITFVTAPVSGDVLTAMLY